MKSLKSQVPKQPLPVPFDEDDNLITYVGCYDINNLPKTVYGHQIRWVNNYIFKDKVEIQNISRGQSSVTLVVKSLTDGRVYEIFYSYIESILKEYDI
jgi:hypothetical protein